MGGGPLYFKAIAAVSAAEILGHRVVGSAVLLLAGAVTTTPLLLYGAALGRLRLSTMGLLQYLVPSLHFALAVFVFGESFTAAHAVSFGCIWAGLALYMGDALGATRSQRREVVAA